MELVQKNRLEKLLLSCKPVQDAGDENIDRSTEVFEELRPPSSLECLWIDDFYGRSFPNWMSSSSGISLHNLVHLEIRGCERCQQLPQLGKLPQLKSLTVLKASSIPKIGPEFLGRGGRSTIRYLFVRDHYLRDGHWKCSF